MDGANAAMFGLEWWEAFVGGICTIAIFSFLYRENPFYRFFEHLYIGIATGIGVMATINTFLWPTVFKPMVDGERIPFPDGTFAEPYNSMYMLYLIPIAFGSLYYFILSRKYNWIAQIVIGFTLGYGGGLAFKATFNEMLPQLEDSFRPLYVAQQTAQDAAVGIDWLATFSNVVFIFTLITALSYFFFTFKRSEGGVTEKSALAGRWMMMGCFGAFFGATIMARMALLVERLEFLINKWFTLFIA
ncbi:MAG: hypothetical protein KDD66_09030 [Bdellovibrionales bacterium]|nr:hypothetical protein [Bdellovibrionales bacterium]